MIQYEDLDQGLTNEETLVTAEDALAHLEKVFVDTITDLKSEKELYYRKGQIDVVKHLKLRLKWASNN